MDMNSMQPVGKSSVRIKILSYEVKIVQALAVYAVGDRLLVVAHGSKQRPLLQGAKAYQCI